MEYNSNIWNPTHVYLIDTIESVQRTFTKRIKILAHLTYPERLSILNLEPLELRRLHYDMVQYYKILNHLTSLNPDDNFTYHYPPASSRDPSTLLVKPNGLTDSAIRLFLSQAHRLLD